MPATPGGGFEIAAGLDVLAPFSDPTQGLRLLLTPALILPPYLAWHAWAARRAAQP